MPKGLSMSLYQIWLGSKSDKSIIKYSSVPGEYRCIYTFSKCNLSNKGFELSFSYNGCNSVCPIIYRKKKWWTFAFPNDISATENESHLVQHLKLASRVHFREVIAIKRGNIFLLRGFVFVFQSPCHFLSHFILFFLFFLLPLTWGEKLGRPFPIFVIVGKTDIFFFELRKQVIYTE